MGDAHTRDGWPRAGLIAAIVGVQCVLLAWWVWEPLPNAQNANPKSPMRRGTFLLTAVPQIVPGVTYRASGIGRIAGEFEHPETLPQRLPILVASALIFAGAMGIGELALRVLNLRSKLSWQERIPLMFGLGIIGLSLMTLGLGRIGFLNTWAIRGVLAILATVWIVLGRSRSEVGEPRAEDGKLWILLALAALPFVLLMALASIIPTFDYDAIEYHLQGPKEYYQNGRITFLPHNVYTSMPFGVEMIHLLGMVVMGDWWTGALVGQFFVMLHAPMAAAMIGLTASRLASPRAGWFASFFYLTTPWIYRMGALPYVEGPMLYYHAAALWAVTSRRWTIAGLMAGGAMACKYPALISAVLPFGLMAVCTRSPRAVGAFALGVGIAIGPWLAKNTVDTGNPVYPLGYKILGGSPWSPEREAKWQSAHGPRPHSTAALLDGLLDVAGRSDWQSILFVAFGPLAFLTKASRRSSLLLLTYAAYIFGTWYLLTHRLDRFWLPILIPMAILAGQGADWTRSRGWSIWLGFLIAVVTIANFFYATSPLTALNEWTADLSTMPLEMPRRINGPLAAMDESLPPDARPLLVGQAAVFHLKHRVIYNTVFNEEIFETIARDRSPEEVRRALIDRGITHVYVDWPEVERHRKPGGYGFTSWIQPDVFADLMKAGVLESMPPTGPDRDLFRVVPK